ncbi:MAG TPA: hypothetical protein VK920_09410 [Solirubrobacterales bacterium]|nr:hypothetical protein [Solirubrobacterales bacterium]
MADLDDCGPGMPEPEFRREWDRATPAERADYMALAGQRIAQRMEVLEAAQERVACLDAVRELLVRSGAPPGMGLGSALVAGYVSAEEVVEAVRAVPDPLAE